MDLRKTGALELNDLLREKKISCREVVDDVFAAIATEDDKIHAFISLSQNEAYAQAAVVDAKLAKGEEIGRLEGVPIALKDNLCVSGGKTTCASRILSNFISPYDAHVVTQVKDAGMVIIGKNNMDEFAMGSSTENSSVGPTHNPSNLLYAPGGSSGGSAAAVAAGFVPLSLGSDTGGSIRQPASFCGVVGLKPTYGRVSRWGLVAFASSLDQIGPFARNVEDSAALLQVISGYDKMDSTVVKAPVPDYNAALNGNIKGLKIGLPKEYFTVGLDQDVYAKVRAAIDVLVAAGAEPVEISLPHTDYAVATYYIIATAEASANLARFDGVRYGMRSQATDLAGLYANSRHDGLGAEVKRRIMLGTYVLSSGFYDAYYLKAQKARTLIRQDLLAAYKQVDVIVTPTSPTPPFRIGERSDDPLSMYLSDVFTIAANLAGIPALSIPCGQSDDGLPIGLHLMGQDLKEAELLNVAYAYQQSKGE